MVQIILADDHTIVREGLKQILTECPDFKIVGEAANGQSLLEQVREKGCDVVLLDIAMPGRNGLEILKQLKSEKPNLKVLILSMHPEDQYAVRAITAGASGYLTKVTASDRLIEAIKTVHSGRKYVSPTLAERLAETLTEEVQGPPHELLSDREYEVLLLLARGKAPSAIASEMFLSVKTVSTYRSRILEKLNLKTNTDLVRYVLDHNLL